MHPHPAFAENLSAVPPLAQPPALLLAAGRGERMRPLTDATPKPLLVVQGRPLLEWHLCALAAAGVPRAVVNTAWLGGQIRERLGAVFSSPSPSEGEAVEAGAADTPAQRPHPGPVPHAGQGEAADSNAALLSAPVGKGDTAGNGAASLAPILPAEDGKATGSGAVFLPPLPRAGEGWGEGATDQGAPAEISSLFALQTLPVKRKQLSISYSNEAQDFGYALETAGGIARALPQLAGVFWLAAGDVFAPDFTFDAAAAQRFAASDALAHLWLVPNPAHHPGGDFALGEDGLAFTPAEGSTAPRYTYSTLALLRAELFALPWCDIAPGNPQGVAAPLAPLLRRAMQAGRVSAELYRGRWTDVGTPERLAALNAAPSTPR